MRAACLEVDEKPPKMTIRMKKRKASGEKASISAYIATVHVSNEIVCRMAMKATGTESKDAMS